MTRHDAVIAVFTNQYERGMKEDARALTACLHPSAMTRHTARAFRAMEGRRL